MPRKRHVAVQILAGVDLAASVPGAFLGGLLAYVFWMLRGELGQEIGFASQTWVVAVAALTVLQNMLLFGAGLGLAFGWRWGRRLALTYGWGGVFKPEACSSSVPDGSPSGTTLTTCPKRSSHYSCSSWSRARSRSSPWHSSSCVTPRSSADPTALRSENSSGIETIRPTLKRDVAGLGAVEIRPRGDTSGIVETRPT